MPNYVKKIKDLTDVRVGRLTVLRKSLIKNKPGKPIKWLCQCDCGKQKEINSTLIRNKGVLSCGCLRKERAKEATFIDLTGNKFNRLTVLMQCEDKPVKWLCKCECGNLKKVGGGSLKRGTIKSCGCYKVELKSKSPKSAGINKKLASYKENAKSKGLVFELNKDDFIKITSSNCYYCDSLPSQVWGNNNQNRGTKQSSHGNYVCNGIDRKSNFAGYTLDNCVPCCKICNRAKNSMSFDEFIEYLIRISLFHK